MKRRQTVEILASSKKLKQMDNEKPLSMKKEIMNSLDETFTKLLCLNKTFSNLKAIDSQYRSVSLPTRIPEVKKTFLHFLKLLKANMRYDLCSIFFYY